MSPEVVWPDVVLAIRREYMLNATTRVIIHERRMPLNEFAILEARETRTDFSLWPRRRWLPKWLR